MPMPALFLTALAAGASFWAASHILPAGPLLVAWKGSAVALLAVWVARAAHTRAARGLAVAGKIASKSGVVSTKIKAAVNRGFELGNLTESIKAEHNDFISCWATEDQAEGMTAFAEKRKPTWKHR